MYPYLSTVLCQVGEVFVLCLMEAMVHQTSTVFRWFKFTLKPPYTIMHGNLSSAIWDTSHLTSFVKFGLKTA